MRTADNMTYKDDYLFNNIKFKEELPSVNVKPDINTILKENPYKANVEVEGGEVVLQPDLSALFNASGKKHSKGGVDVYLKPNAFVFSDFKDLAFDKKDHDLMELKKGGNFNKQNNTPAKVLKRNVDVKHYNTLVNNLSDVKVDSLAKKSSALMLEKYINTLGNIAYTQEKKKNFPSGIPFFSEGTAPVYADNIKEEIMESKQYAKYGGKIDLPKAQTGNPYNNPFFRNMYDNTKANTYLPQYPVSKNPNLNNNSKIENQPITSPTITSPNLENSEYLPPYNPPMPDGYGTQDQLEQQMKEFNKLTGMNFPLNREGLLQARNIVIELYPEFIHDYYTRQRVPINNSLYRTNPSLKGYSTEEEIKSYRDLPNGSKLPLYGNELINFQNVPFLNKQEYDNFIKDKIPIKREDKVIGYADPNKKGYFYIPKLYNTPNINREEVLKQVNSTYKDTPISSVGPNKGNPNYINTGEVKGVPQGWKSADWEFTPYQKMSQLNSLAQYANIHRYMPYRSRYNATYAEPHLLNPEQAVGDAKGITYQNLKSLETLNPILRNAQAADSVAKLYQNIPGIRSQYDNQNTQIANQFRQYNNQIRNNESMANSMNDQKYYMQAVEGRKNFDNMRTAAWNNYMNLRDKQIQENQQLAYNLLTQNNPAYKFDFRTGKLMRTNKSILDTQENVVNDRYNTLLKSINALKDPTERAKLLVKLEGLRVFGSAQTSNNPFSD